MQKKSIIYNLSNEEFKAIVETSHTMVEILEKCGLRAVGSNRFTVRKRALAEGVTLDHLGIRKEQDRVNPVKIPLDQILIEHSTYKSGRLKKQLVKLGMLEDKCTICGQEPTWNGKPLVLHLDHINGKHEDNRLENLRVVCPHCDSQLSTYKGRNKYHAPEPRCTCGAPKCKVADQCKKCANQNRETKIEWPSIEILEQMLQTLPMTQVAQKLKVSSQAVKKHIRKYSLRPSLNG